jgi:hypothetical protein
MMEKKTNYQLSTSVNEGILEIVIAGEVTESTVNRLHTDVITIIQEKKPRALLIDISALKGCYEDFVAAYFRVRSIPPDVQKLPSAVVDLSKNVAFQSFYETTAANVGQSVKWFTDIETARAWLKSRLQKSYD